MWLPIFFIPTLISTIDINGSWQPSAVHNKNIPLFSVINETVTATIGKTVIEAKIEKKTLLRYRCYNPKVLSLDKSSINLSHAKHFMIVRHTGFEFQIQPLLYNNDLLFVTWFLHKKQGTFFIKRLKEKSIEEEYK